MGNAQAKAGLSFRSLKLAVICSEVLLHFLALIGVLVECVVDAKDIFGVDVVFDTALPLNGHGRHRAINETLS